MNRLFYPVLLLQEWLGPLALLGLQAVLLLLERGSDALARLRSGLSINLQQHWLQQNHVLLRQQQQLQQRLDEIAHASGELERSATQVTPNAESRNTAAETAAAAVEELRAWPPVKSPDWLIGDARGKPPICRSPTRRTGLHTTWPS